MSERSGNRSRCSDCAVYLTAWANIRDDKDLLVYFKENSIVSHTAAPLACSLQGIRQAQIERSVGKLIQSRGDSAAGGLVQFRKVLRSGIG